MGTENENMLDYGTFLADLERKKSLLEHAIASLKAVMAGGALVSSIGDSMPGMVVDDVSLLLRGNEVPVGAFLGKSIPEAAKLCLQIVKRKMTSREISEYLTKGGIETTARNFPSLVHSILIRASSKSPSDIVKLDRSHWGLSEWYPAALRGGSAGRPVKAKKARRNHVLVKPSKQVRKGTESQIIEYLRSKAGTEFAPQEIASSLGMRIQTVHFLLGKLAFRKEAEKTAGGKYRAIAA